MRLVDGNNLTYPWGLKILDLKDSAIPKVTIIFAHLWKFTDFFSLDQQRTGFVPNGNVTGSFFIWWRYSVSVVGLVSFVLQVHHSDGITNQEFLPVNISITSQQHIYRQMTNRTYEKHDICYTLPQSWEYLTNAFRIRWTLKPNIFFLPKVARLPKPALKKLPLLSDLLLHTLCAKDTHVRKLNRKYA